VVYIFIFLSNILPNAADS